MISQALKILFVGGLLALNFGLVNPAAVLAADPLDSACAQLSEEQRAKSTSCSSRTDKNPLTGTDGLLMKIANIIAIIAGITAVVMMIVSGFRMITANGDAQKFASARGTAIGAVVGIIIIVLARSLVLLILEKL